MINQKLLIVIWGLLMLTGGLKSQSTFINEINYLASNPDQGIEVAGQAGQDLAGWELVVYGISGTVTATKSLSGVIPNQQNGYGAIWYDVDQGAGGNGVALVNPSNNVVQFLSYGVDLLSNDLIVTATEGIAMGMTSTYTEEQLLATNSLQLAGTGSAYPQFSWAIPGGTTKGARNTNQVFSTALPIELLAFSAQQIEEGIKVEWATVQEIDLAYFQLEKSEDGIAFYPIYQREGMGTPEGVRHYAYLDKGPHSPVNYYRLVNVDADGSADMSRIIVANFRKSGIKQCFLIPGTSKLMIQFQGYSGNRAGWATIYGLSGLNRGRHRLKLDGASQEIDLSALNPGAYFVKINLEGEVYTELIIKN